jgi:hypothetical protein
MSLDYLAEFDRDNRNLVLTAFGPGEPFEALMGAYAQGDGAPTKSNNSSPLPVYMHTKRHYFYSICGSITTAHEIP